MTYRAGMLGVLFLQAACALAAAPPKHAAAAAAAVPAQWMPHNLIVSLTQLPRGYSCNELWYRFHDVLEAIGAREVQILTYECSDKVGHAGGAPKVELKFQLPGALAPAEARFADFSAFDSTVHLAPGSPHSLTGEDCELVRQLSSGLLAGLGLRVTDAQFPCQQSGARERFSVTVHVLLPAEAAAGTQPTSGPLPGS